ncbi:DUF6361 family protein [Curtobacterium flaccumfaciens]|uniref:DUF6361 family protein n=1 Tax=Curtobacterium poinsettiae TaxID=159612 RepID=A0A9Q9P578_9MICO|nr:DUF6361 family protein [Curtobacterium flaccumfaciens]UXN24513.1 DUF6361 family protein [Curtobacterium flaccumfaciens]UYC79349.1 DUF6361 family protein [Curtobacterium flaccumfaciens pv. poinsettiae]
MPSLIAWLDASSDEQRRMREIIALFTDRDSRDELGIGQIRDAISNGLFPGTSTLLTRARYALFVPWCFQLAAQRPDPREAAARNERTLISALRRTNERGVLGLRAGETLKTLPSSLYWGTLRTYGILDDSIESTTDLLNRLRERDRRGIPASSEDDLLDQSGRAWTPTFETLPMPDGFPSSVDGGFDLTNAEAGFLRDRVLERAPGTVMAHLVTTGVAPNRESPSPWADPATDGLPAEARDLLRLAATFSIMNHGAALLYNLMLAEERAEIITSESGASDPDGTDAAVTDYRDALTEWALEADAAEVTAWDTTALWAWLATNSTARIAGPTRGYVDQWTKHLRDTDLASIADDDTARGMVRARERSQKRGLARLGNPDRLRGWTGASGSNALTYRWQTVRNIVIDIREGLARDA